MTTAYGALIKAIEGFRFRYEPTDVPLDEELFIHLHRLEFVHFAAGYEPLMRVAIPNFSIIPVFEELKALAKGVFPRAYLAVNECDPLISIRDVPAFSRRWQNEIACIIEKAMGVSLTSRDLGNHGQGPEFVAYFLLVPK